MITGAPYMLKNAEAGVPYAEIFVRSDKRLNDYFVTKDGKAVSTRFGKRQYISDFAAKLFTDFLYLIINKAIDEGRPIKLSRTGKSKIVVTNQFYLDRLKNPSEQPKLSRKRDFLMLLVVGDTKQRKTSNLRYFRPFRSIEERLVRLGSKGLVKAQNLSTLPYTKNDLVVDDVLDELMERYDFLYRNKVKRFLYWGLREILSITRAGLNVSLRSYNPITKRSEKLEVFYRSGGHTGDMKARRTLRFKHRYPEAYKRLLKKNMQRALQHVRDNNLTELPMKYKIFLENEQTAVYN